MAKVLIIDDDQLTCSVLSEFIHHMGHEAVCRGTLKEGLETALATPYEVVFLDVQMPDGSGLEILPEIRATESSPDVIIMTGFGTADGAEIAIKSGAWDYIQKADSPRKIILSLQRILQYRESLRKTRSTPRALKLDEIIGTSLPMKACYDWLAQVSGADGNVLLTGETGTGKELFARAIHENSDRAANNFVVVDCAALPETLVESILFGHEKGAYTGADQPRQGLIAQAHSGTLFLDEIGELPLNIQKVFLRVLQEKRYRPVGSNKERESNFRVVAATNRDLDMMEKDTRFRKDLLYRLRTFSMTLPPLRDRSEDIKALANHFILKICDRQKIANKGTSPDFFDRLTRYLWPGNVRELINTLETAISSAGIEETLFSRHLPEYIRIKVARATLDNDYSKGAGGAESDKSTDSVLSSFKSYRKAAVRQAEKEYLRKLALKTRGDVNVACRISGLSRSRYYELIKLHEITPG